MNTGRLSAKILVIGSISMDLVVRTPVFPKDGETVMGVGFHRSPGGKGANQAVAAARLGASVTMAGKVGCDEFGNELLAVLKHEGVSTDHVMRDETTPTGVASITVDIAGNNRIVVAPGANSSYTPSDLNTVNGVIQECDLVMLQLEVDIGVVEEAVRIASRQGVPVLLNPAPAKDLSDDLIRQVMYLTPNETEAEHLTGVRISSLDDAQRSAGIMLARGVRHVVITLADKGALIATEDMVRHVAAFPVVPVDTVAAGDAFSGALAVALAAGEPLLQAVRFASAAGALAVTKSGAIPSLPRLDDVLGYLNQLASVS